MSAGGAPDSTGRRHVVIVGPTASGKSDLALELAERLGDAEIVSIDSMCVYRHMDIGTAKPAIADRRRVRHHLVDVVDPDAEFSVGEFQRLALDAIDDIEGRGLRAILVGGTGLYHRAVIDRLQIPGRWPEVAAELDPDRDDPAGTLALHDRLVALDPASAQRIEPTNRRRIVRALEVTVGSGRPFSSYGPGLERYEPSAHLMFGLHVDRDRLGPRIDARVASMMEAGLLTEVAELRARFTLSRTARQALGYRDLLGHLDGLDDNTAGELAEVVGRIGVRTRRFAVRQDRWFRRDQRLRWMGAEAGDLASQVLDVVERADHGAEDVQIRVGRTSGDHYRDLSPPTTEAP